LYNIIYTEGALEDLKKLPSTILKRVEKAIQSKLALNPIDFGKPLQYSYKGYRRLRVGDYRIIYHVKDREIIVVIVEVQHRSKVYNT